MKIMGLLAIFALVLSFVSPVLAEDGAPAASGRELRAISEKQDKILAVLEEIKTELAIVKVRATNRG